MEKNLSKRNAFKIIKRVIKKFREGNSKVLILHYDKRHLNSDRDYHRILLRAYPYRIVA